MSMKITWFWHHLLMTAIMVRTRFESGLQLCLVLFLFFVQGNCIIITALRRITPVCHLSFQMPCSYNLWKQNTAEATTTVKLKPQRTSLLWIQKYDRYSLVADAAAANEEYKKRKLGHLTASATLWRLLLLACPCAFISLSQAQHKLH